MTDFKEMIRRDITDVFENAEEFAEEVTIEYDRKKFTCIAVLDTDTEDDPEQTVQHVRNKRADTGNYGVHQCDLVMYAAYEKFPVEPIRGKSIRVNTDMYTISSIGREGGEYVLGLLRYAN